MAAFEITAAPSAVLVTFTCLIRRRIRARKTMGEGDGFGRKLHHLDSRIATAKLNRLVSPLHRNVAVLSTIAVPSFHQTIKHP